LPDFEDRRADSEGDIWTAFLWREREEIVGCRFEMKGFLGEGSREID